MQGRTALRADGPEDRVAWVVDHHGRALLRTANHWSLCHDDALDAYQRALEIFLRRADTVDRETEVAWLKVVVKHEALAIRRARAESVSGEEPDLDARVEPTQRTLDDQVAGVERVGRSADALRALKPDERRALMLKAQGYSYEEIGSRLGWTYTKVNRSITEGRRRFMKVFAAIESGEACEQYVTTIAALAGGTASSAAIVEIRPHLRHCSACRATVRRLHLAAGAKVKVLLPPMLLAPFARFSVSPDAALPSEDLIREIPLDGPPHVDRGWLGRIRDELLTLMHRTNSSDAAAGAYIATSGGGGRIATIATIIGFCLSGAGAGALCVATGVMEAPGWLFGPEARPPLPKPAADAKPAPAREPETTPHAALEPSPAAVAATATPSVAHRAGPQVRSPSRSTTPTRSTAKQTQAREFGFEQHPSPRPSSVATTAGPAPTSATSSGPSIPTTQTQQEFGP